MQPAIVFVARTLGRDWPDIATLDEAGLDREHARFRRGIENWIVQTYVRLRGALRARGFEVRIGERFERGAICVAHRDDLNRYGDPLHDCYIVAARADRPPVRVAQIEVVQNRQQAGSSRARLVPHWPQPGLLARDPARGARLERAVYYGRDNSVPAWYRDPAFHRALAALGVSLVVRDHGWNDYRDVDIVLAHRDETPSMLANKPASKLVNAWLAGVPALAAPEPAFEALQRSPLDFVATRDAASTLAALEALVRDPGRYRAMVDNGRRRAGDFSVEAVRARWLDLLAGEAAPAFRRWRARPAPARWAQSVLAMTAQKLEAKRFRAREERERRQLGRGRGAALE